MKNRIYVAIDLKSFYASWECIERGLDPLTTNLVVADASRTEKTICLAVSPAMKAQGVKNRCRVFEIPKHIQYITAPPRMKKYIEVSADIYEIYLKYISKDDIHVYSIDEVFMDVTDYLALYQMTARELGIAIMKDVYEQTGIMATCGIGTNLYLAKVALDITAKHSEDRIGELTEETYCETLWNHRPLTDFWRVGSGIAKRLERYGIFTMEGVAHMDEDVLYHDFGVDAELLIDHAWGREPVTMEDIKKYKAQSRCLTSGQVLMRDYEHEEGKLIVKEMMDLLCLDMVEKGLVTQSVTLHMGYSNELKIPGVHGTVSFTTPSNSARSIIPQVEALYERLKDPALPIRRVNICCNRVTEEGYRQYDLFSDPVELEREHKMQQAVIGIKRKFGKNAILKGMNLEEGAMTMERNLQIGGHKSGETK
ncbi:MAG: DNA repair protein [Lachnospiraceae bacterium]|nr:DNA repair protein [Lachnospiraceae bacterium]